MIEMNDVVFEEVKISEIRPDVIKVFTPPIVDNPAEPSDVLFGKEYIGQAGEVETGTATLNTTTVEPTEEEQHILPDGDSIGFSDVVVEKIPMSYVLASVEGETLMLNRSSVEDETLTIGGDGVE